MFRCRPLRSRKRNRSGYANNIALTIGGEALRASGKANSKLLILRKLYKGIDRKALSGLEPANPVNGIKITGTP